jgi:squalene/oxidosqualene cyclase-like protein
MDYGGPMFLMPGLIIASYITGVDLGPAHRAEMLRYLGNMQNEDGGWGLHIESPSTMFGTALNYVACRLLGMDPDEKITRAAREWIHAEGGAQSIPSWGKFWLATLGVYEWEGLNPLPPEMWLLPYWMPMHPGRFWCHCRIVYLPMSYIYGRKATCPLNDLTREIRAELYPQGYAQIDWPQQKWNCHAVDMYFPPRWFLKALYGVLSFYETHHSASLRDRALAEAMLQIDAEDESTDYICIGPVNKAINMLAVFWEHGADSAQFRRHKERLPDYLWLGVDGMKMQGYNGSQLWDCAFAVQAIAESGMADAGDNAARKSLVNGMKYIDTSQVRVNSPNPTNTVLPTPTRFYRHTSKGAWPFSTVDHGWPISDCTAEGLKASLVLGNLDFIEHKLPADRMFDAVNVILSLQQPRSGGWASYELKRGPDMLELLNPSEVFYNIIVDYPYVECSSACMTALVAFQKEHPSHRAGEIADSLKRGRDFVQRIQRSDGSWLGSWAVCVAYGTWFGVEALVATGSSPESLEIRRACDFLVGKQRADGGWGEDFTSCVEKRWVEHEDSQVVTTAWCLLSLMAAHHADESVIRRGITFLLSRQQPDGDWEQEGISGVFNANCAISYSSYKNTFSIWALARFRQQYANVEALG